jgi:N-acetylmuramoyl-L-alanine amidase
LKLFRFGSSGREVADIQSRLILAGFLDGNSIEVKKSFFGKETEKAVISFQENRGLRIDGIVGPDTWRSLVEASHVIGSRFLYLREPPFRGDDVSELQRRLNILGFYSGKEDGIFDEQVARAVEQFQRNTGLPPDGVAGPKTIASLLRLSRITRREGIAPFRESEKGLPTGGIQGRRVMLDPGHGAPADPGEVGPKGVTESECALRIAFSLSKLLIKEKTTTILSRRPGEYFSEEERASRANAQGVELVLSIHAGASKNPEERGIRSYYYARGGYHSPYGFRLANHLQEDLTRVLGSPNLGAHGAAFTILRDTKMPVVVIEPFFVTNPEEESMALSEEFIEKIANAILCSLKKYFSGVKSIAED